MTSGRWLLSASLLLALVLGVAPQVSATTLTLDIDDSTEGPLSVTLTNSDSNTTTQLGPFFPENTGNTDPGFFVSTQGFGTILDSGSSVVELLDLDGQVSDILHVRFTVEEPNVGITVISDPKETSLGTCVPSTNISCTPEDGTFQTLVTITLATQFQDNHLVVRARSDVDAPSVPEPATLALLGLGLAGLGFSRRRKSN